MCNGQPYFVSGFFGGDTSDQASQGCSSPTDLITCSDIDMMSTNADGRFVHKDGMPYPER